MALNLYIFQQGLKRFGGKVCFPRLLNPFPHDKILDQTKLKVFADDKLNITTMLISVFDRVKNIV